VYPKLRVSMNMSASLRASMGAPGRLLGSDIQIDFERNYQQSEKIISELFVWLQNVQRVYRTRDVSMHSIDGMGNIDY